MPLHPEAATPADEENFLNRTFDRISRDGLHVDSACRTLNHVYRGLYGINTISQILIANGVAEDCDQAPLNDTVVGGLLDAVNALSSLMMIEIDRLADRAAFGVESTEVRHG